MGFVKGVSSEGDHDVPQSLDGIVGVTVFTHTRLEGDEVFLQDVLLFLTHRSAQQVGATQGVPGKFSGDRHDLLLVHNEVVRGSKDLVEVFLEFGMDRNDRFPVVLTLSIRDMRISAHRARAIQG